MILWTLQPLDVYQEIICTGKYVCKPRLSVCLSEMGFRDAYDWLVRQMIKRIGLPPNGVIYPVWAWHTTYNQHKKPDLRRMDFRESEAPMVCIEIEKADDEVLLSDEENWHFVLNNQYFSENEDEDRIFNTLSEYEQEKVKIKSWERIFDITAFENEWMRRGCFIQATFWMLELKDIRRIWHYGAKYNN